MLAAPALQEDSGGDLEDFYDCRIARRVPDRFNDDLPLRIRRECPETIREVFCTGRRLETGANCRILALARGDSAPRPLRSASVMLQELGQILPTCLIDEDSLRSGFEDADAAGFPGVLAMPASCTFRTRRSGCHESRNDFRISRRAPRWKESARLASSARKVPTVGSTMA